MRHLTIAVLVTMMLLASTGIARGAPEAKSSGTIKLTYDSTGASRARTPGWAMGYNRFSVGSSASRMGIRVGGTTVKTSARVSGKTVYLGFDRSGDGTISKAEWAPIPRSKTMLISGKAAGTSYVIRLVDIVARYNKTTVTCWGQALIRSSMKGTLGRTPVRILDDDMDGKFSQTGSARGGDAILIGSSSAAVPLRAMHRIGKNIYRLKVASDGSSIDYELVADTAVGQVRAMFPANTMKSLVLVGRDCAFDVKTDGVAGIPAGPYLLAYGVVSSSATTLTFRPGRGTPQYDIKDGMINTLRIGKPVRVNFAASYGKGKVGLSASMVSIVGSGSEVYGPLDFTKGGNIRPPTVTMLNGRRVASSSTMKYG
ncbi:MAG: hypothetical protein QGH60_01785 [Phycisphaerae bacterium]|jgi:hypothetical protein|nr:hypothetical protein [Phycisphaerae bacterium]